MIKRKAKRVAIRSVPIVLLISGTARRMSDVVFTGNNDAKLIKATKNDDDSCKAIKAAYKGATC